MKVSNHRTGKSCFFMSILFLCIASGSISLFAQTASWRSTTNQSKWADKGSLTSVPWSKSYTKYVELFPDSQYQTIEGFGGCFSEKAWDALSVLSSTGRDSIVRALFDTSGCNFNVCRLPLGANDFADSYYSLNDNENDYAMENFNLTRDKTKIIPLIKDAMVYKPDLRLWGSPWTPPQWMKTTKLYNGNGHLTQDAQTLTAFALYLAKAVSAFQAEGINLATICPQNEPTQGNGQLYPSCVWSPAEYQNFYKNYLIPRFIADGVKADLMLGTFCVGTMQDWVQSFMNDPVIFNNVPILGFQQVISPNGSWAANARKLFPTKRVYETETNCCHSNDWAGGRTEFNLLSAWLGSSATVYSEWNMVLDETGLSGWNWKQAAMVTVNKTTKAVTYNPHFYAVKHFTNFIKPNARLIKSINRDTWNKSAFGAYLNPNGELIVVTECTNYFGYSLTIKLGNRAIRATLPANSFNTFRIKPASLGKQIAAHQTIENMDIRPSTLFENPSIAAGMGDMEFVLTNLKGAVVWSERCSGKDLLAGGVRPIGKRLEERGIPSGAYFLSMKIKAAGSRAAATLAEKVSIVY